MARAIADDCIPPKFLQSYKVYKPVQEKRFSSYVESFPYRCFFISVPGTVRTIPVVGNVSYTSVVN